MTSLLAIALTVFGSAMVCAASRSVAELARISAEAEVILPWRQIFVEMGIERRLGGLGLALVGSVCLLLSVQLLGFGLTLGIVTVGLIVLPDPVQRWWTRRRIRRFESQLPDVLDGIAGILRAGQAMGQALRIIADRFPDPAGSVFRSVVHQMELGQDMPTALRSATGDYRVSEWTLFTQSAAVVTRTGGSLAEVAEKSARTVRRRRRVEERLRTLTAQARTQAWVMGLLPLAMLVGLRHIEPLLFRQLTGTAAGWGVLLAALVLQLSALWLMRRILRAEF